MGSRPAFLSNHIENRHDVSAKQIRLAEEGKRAVAKFAEDEGFIARVYALSEKPETEFSIGNSADKLKFFAWLLMEARNAPAFIDCEELMCGELTADIMREKCRLLEEQPFLFSLPEILSMANPEIHREGENHMRSFTRKLNQLVTSPEFEAYANSTFVSINKDLIRFPTAR